MWELNPKPDPNSSSDPEVKIFLGLKNLKVKNISGLENF